jgi:hypothetical protein
MTTTKRSKLPNRNCCWWELVDIIFTSTGIPLSRPQTSSIPHLSLSLQICIPDTRIMVSVHQRNRRTASFRWMRLALLLLLIGPSLLHAWKKNHPSSASNSPFATTFSPAAYDAIARLRERLRQRRRDERRQRQSIERQYQQNLTQQMLAVQERGASETAAQLQAQARAMESQYQRALQEQLDRLRQEHSQRQFEWQQQHNATMTALHEQHQQQLQEQKLRVKKLLQLIQQMQRDADEGPSSPLADNTVEAEPAANVTTTTTTRRKVKRTASSQTRSTVPP